MSIHRLPDRTGLIRSCSHSGPAVLKGAGPDPDLVIVGASEEYRRATLLWREVIEGRRLFDVFPDNPGDLLADGVSHLRASINRVLEQGTPDRMSVQYDVRDHVSGSGAWVEKFWLPTNVPVFDSGSREVTFIIHEVEDVTGALELERWLKEQRTAVQEQLTTLDRMRHILGDRLQRLDSTARQPGGVSAACRPTVR